MIIIYSDIITSRLIYTLNVLFKYVLGVDYKLTNKLYEFKKSSLPKINYSSKIIEKSLQIIPSKLLFEKGIKNQNIELEWRNHVPYFFKTKGDFLFDIFASTFYMVSRYEEYLPFQSDVHGRFKAEDSLSFKNNFLKKPVVNLWSLELQNQLLTLFPALSFSKKKTSYLNTLDIDIAYAYKAKGTIRFLGGFFKAMMKREIAEIQERKQYLRSKTDPFDTYSFIADSSKGVKTKYFFLLGDRAKHDVNIHHKRKGLKKLILKLNEQHSIGIHPSYQSNKKPELLSKEVKRLENILRTKVTSSRQHFLKMSLPFTYENLISQKITKDYTMGFASQIGFRAGICNVYPFYNLEKEEQRPLWIVPFQVMDGTLNKYLNLTPEQAVVELKNLINEVNNVNGLFVSLWHNSSLGETTIWKGWKKVYKEMLILMK
ncbi:polysaccharide deacetylase family protein [Wenyingzhuangia sp. IMCC45467]